MNFVHSFPHSVISIALLINKTTENGIVFNPVLGQKFTARRGQGAFYNGKQIHVSDERNLTEKAKKARCLGGAILNICMVALGAAECAYDFGAHAWDYTASKFIVREAGGVTNDPSGGTFDFMSRRLLVANSPEIATALSKELIQFYASPRDDE